MNNELQLNGIVYDLNKVKEKDEYTFLMACQELGSYNKIEGFLNKVVYFFVLFFNPIGIEATNEYKKASYFFINRKKKKEELIVNKMLRSLELK